MSAKFYTLLTEIGAAKLASSAALGVPLNITRMAVGDGGGVLPTPNAQQTKLVAEKRRADLNMLYIDPQNSSQIIAEQVIPETEGGWWIREVGLFDDTGALIAVGNCPESYKPQLAEGSGRTQTVRMVLITSSTENVTLKIDPAVVLATRKYVDDKALELKVYVDDQLAKHIAAADPHTQYAQKDSPTLTGTPKTPTAPAGTNTTQIASTAFVQAVVTALNNALALKAPLASPGLTGAPTAPTAAPTVNNTQIATTAFVKSALAALVGSSPAALDTLNELAAALGNDPNFATTMTNALAGKQPLNDTLTNLSGKNVSGLLEYLGLSDIPGRLLNVQLFTSSGTYVPSTGTKNIVVECQGGGGGGGAAVITGAVLALSAGCGGAAGSYAKGRFTNIASSYPVIIGSGGSGSSSTGNLGGAGGTSSFGNLISSSGGYGATSISEGNTPFIANGSGQSLPGGTFVTGGNLISSPGQNLGGEAFRLSAGIGSGGYGQASIFGGGGNAAKSANQSGSNGLGYGSGGGGARVAGVTALSYAGGDGASGVVIVWEYS